MRVRRLRAAHRAAWEGYLTAAHACGLLDGESRNDLRARLTGKDDAGFRSAMAECLACWFFAAKLGLPVEPRPSGRGGSVLELLIRLSDGDLHAEVKAPYRELPAGRIGYGDDSDALAKCLEQAEKQFAKGVRNVLFLVPRLRTQVFALSRQLIQAFHGEFRFVAPIDVAKGEAVGPLRPEFFPEGRFLKLRRGGKPCYTRVGAVISVEEDIDESPGDHWVIAHKAMVVHNPEAMDPIPESIWGAYPQLVRRGERIEWTDGRRIF
ncbi:MAG: hypothetical protein HY721_03040 [Planctomycetes bacterium]|nr:hypothetical protein [Planctomycetota bacterium]